MSRLNKDEHLEEENKSICPRPRQCTDNLCGINDSFKQALKAKKAQNEKINSNNSDNTESK
jgi:hypothetical protein